jgi:phosphotransferase system enzyme I (PtsI)
VHILSGIGVSSGVAVAPAARVVLRQELPSEPGPVADVEAANAQIGAAIEAVAADLQQRAQQSDGDLAAVLTAQAMIVGDPVLKQRILDALEHGQSRIGAVTAAFAEFAEALAAAGPYFADRVADLEDLSYRVAATLAGLPTGAPTLPAYECVLVARDLAPADVAAIDLSHVVAIVTEEGGPTTHTAILAKSLGLPAVLACAESVTISDGATVLVDGHRGAVTVEPEPAAVAQAQEWDRSLRQRLAAATGPGRTRDGHPVQLLLNIGTQQDDLAEIDCEGVGLFRTEFLYLDRDEAPTPDEQLEIYRKVFAAFAGRKVIVRTLDAGADKPLGFAPLSDEPNPALGLRGLRTARRYPELLDTQLQAIAAAAKASDAEVSVMAPMVSTPAEARDFVTRARAFGLTRVGVMAEVPALVLRAGAVLEHCDFLSLGTNDLAQYTFAADRMLVDLVDFVDPWQPALLELVRMAASAGLSANRAVGVCGEAASDPALALVLTGLGVSSLSMAAVSLPAVRAMLAEHTLEQCQQYARMALSAPDAATARQQVRELVG